MREPQNQPNRPLDPVFCFAAGTLIDTPDGARPVEDLTPGDRVSTLDNGSQALRWIGRRTMSRAEMRGNGGLRPVELAPGAFGNTRRLVVSQRHALLLSDWRAEVYFGEDQVLVPAGALVNGTSIRLVAPDEGVTFLHLLFDRHEVIVSEGALSGSFHPGATGLALLTDEEREELGALFPGPSLASRRAAFPIVGLVEARALRLPG